MAKRIARLLVLIGGFLGGAAIASAQEVGLGATQGSSSRSDLVGGAGLHGWGSVDLFSAVRLQASVVREWGRETDRRYLCSFNSLEGGGPAGCVMEEVRRFMTITTADLSAILLSPQWLGSRVGLGASYGTHRFEVGEEGLETGSIHTPAEGRERTLDGRGWLMLVEHGLASMPASLRATYQRYRVDFGPCIMDMTWSLCGNEAFGRFTLGFGYRIF